jgi:hypothetical protein
MKKDTQTLLDETVFLRAELRRINGLVDSLSNEVAECLRREAVAAGDLKEAGKDKKS